jgi:hypothetical protein
VISAERRGDLWHVVTQDADGQQIHTARALVNVGDYGAEYSDLPPNVDDNAGQSSFSNETKAFLRQEQSSPTPPVKNSRIMRLLDKLIY